MIRSRVRRARRRYGKGSGADLLSQFSYPCRFESSPCSSACEEGHALAASRGEGLAGPGIALLSVRSTSKLHDGHNVLEMHRMISVSSKSATSVPTMTS